MAERLPRLGDVIDDYCPRCRLLLNHDISALTNGAVAKVTCRTCHNTHDYRNAQVPVRRKPKGGVDKKKLMDEVLANMGMGALPPITAPPTPPPPPPAEKKKRDLWADVERLKKK